MTAVLGMRDNDLEEIRPSSIAIGGLGLDRPIVLRYRWLCTKLERDSLAKEACKYEHLDTRKGNRDGGDDR